VIGHHNVPLFPTNIGNVDVDDINAEGSNGGGDGSGFGFGARNFVLFVTTTDVTTVDVDVDVDGGDGGGGGGICGESSQLVTHCLLHSTQMHWQMLISWNEKDLFLMSLIKARHLGKRKRRIG
jgi:hypothetical protein